MYDTVHYLLEYTKWSILNYLTVVHFNNSIFNTLKTEQYGKQQIIPILIKIHSYKWLMKSNEYTMPPTKLKLTIIHKDKGEYNRFYDIELFLF